MTSIEALLLLIKTYTGFAGDGIDVKLFPELEAQFDAMPALRANDFDVIAADWTRRGGRPSVRDLMKSLEERCERQAARRVH